MKRIAALLLVMLLLPGLTFAEGSGYAVNASFTVSREMAGDVLTVMLDSRPADFDSVAEALAELLSSVTLSGRCCMTDTAAQVEGRLELLDTCVADLRLTTDQGLGITSITSDSLLPGVALTFALSPEKLASAQSIWHAWGSIGPTALWERIDGCLRSWSGNLPCREERGAFMGDLFDGGTFCQTYEADDRDLVLLADLLLDELEQMDTPLKARAALYPDGLNLLALARQALHRTALTNRFAYRLRAVYDDAEELKGLSLTVLDQAEQVSTLSMAPMADGVKLVWGYGVSAGNCYLEATLQGGMDGEVTNLTAEVRVYADLARGGYRAAVSAGAVCDAAGRLSIRRESDGSAQWDAEWDASYINMPDANERLKVQGEWVAPTGEFRMAADLYAGNREQPGLTIALRGQPDSEPPADLTGLEAIGIQGEDQESARLINELVAQSVREVVLKLFKRMPTPLMMLFFMQ